MINTRFFSYFLLICTLSLSAFSIQAGTAKKLPVLDRMIASVNGEAITESELNQQTELLTVRLKQTDTTLPPLDVLHKQLLDRMILERLQLQLAAADGIEVDDATLNSALEEIAKRDNLSVDEMQKFIEEQGISIAQFRDTIKTEITLSKVQQKEIGQNITISKSDVDHFLRSPAGQDQSGAEYRLGHILIPLPESPSHDQIQKTEDRAEAIVKELNNGADFAKIAISKSAGQHALEGGDLGWRDSAGIPTMFAKIVSTLRTGEVFGPIKDSSGFHIIKLLEKRTKGEETATKTQEIHIRQILIKTNDKHSDEEAKAKLNELREQIIKGSSFSKLAQKYSEEITSATKGGDIGWVTEARVVPEFSKQMKSLKPGEISQPFRTDLGWHLIQVMDKKTREATSEASRNRAMEILYQRKFDELLVPWLRRLRSDADVEIYLNGH